MSAVRVTVTLDRELVDRARAASGRRLSRFVGTAIESALKEERQRKLREDLIEGCMAHAQEDLELCQEWDADLAHWCALIDRE